MTGKEERFAGLFEQYIRRITSEAEEAELMQLLMDPELAAKKAELLEQAYDRLGTEHYMTEVQAASIFGNIVGQPQAEKAPAPVVRLGWKRWAAAASVLLTLGIGAYFILNKPARKQDVAKASTVAHHDVMAPATNRAMITLSNGQTVYLDSAANGKLLQQGGVEIVKLADGKIAYTGSSTDVVYNTLTNPRGSRVIDMVLADGSHVWLNAGSSVTFPLAFTGSERKVSVTGEAYFEVAKKAGMPFIVKVADKCEVEVLGTHFNINSYSDETSVNTTLLEGKVKVTGLRNRESLLLAPGQQAQFKADEQLHLNSNPNLEQVMAWKNGYLHFDNADLQGVMRQIARWYDVEVIYEGQVPKRQFAGEMQLDLNLSQMLRILETNNVHFRIEEGRKLFVGH